MRPEEAARLIALDNPVLAALVGTRISDTKLPQNPVLPAVTYFQVSGRSHIDIPFAMPLIQFTAWGRTRAEARSVADAISWALHRYRGTKGGVKIERIALQGDMDLYDPVTGFYAVPATYRILHEEA
jgi:hypothetical protein